MHGHFVWIIVTVALEEHPSAIAYKACFKRPKEIHAPNSSV